MEKERREMGNLRKGKKEKRNNIIIKGWEVPKRDLLKTAVEEMLKNELKVDAIVEKAFWTKKGTNMVIAKIKDKEQKKEIMIKKKNLKGKNIFIENHLTWKKRQMQKEIRMMAEAEKEKGAKVKIGYRKLQINDRQFVWKGEEGLEEQNFWNRQLGGLTVSEQTEKRRTHIATPSGSVTADRGEGWGRSEETEKPKNKTQIWRQKKKTGRKRRQEGRK